jgi:hypothetical protein
VAAFVKYHTFVDEVSKAGHNLQTAVFKCALTNTAPTPLTDTTWNTTTYVFKLVLADSVFTASGGSIGPFRYAILYNSSATNKVVGYYDYGSSITLADTETLTVDFDGVNGVIQLTMTP